MISKDKQYRTRDGREVRIYATDHGETNYIAGAIKEDGLWNLTTWQADGRYLNNSKETCHDLIEIRPRIKREVWVNIYKDGVAAFESPSMGGGGGRLACVKVVIDCEEGEGL